MSKPFFPIFLAIAALSYTTAMFAEENPNSNPNIEEEAIKQNRKSSPMYVKPDMEEEEKKKRDEHSLPFALGVSYTLWQPYPANVNVLVAKGESSTRGKVVAPQTFAVSGIQVHGEVYTFHDAWRLRADYCWFYFSPHTSDHGYKSNPNLPYDSPFLENRDFDFSDFFSRYKTLFNKLDAYFYKNYQIGVHLTLAPKAGFLGAWEMMRLNFHGNIPLDEERPQATMSQFWWGLGPYTGVQLNFQVFRGLSLYGASNASILYGQYYLNQQNYLINREDQTYQINVNLSDYYYNAAPMLEAKLGFNYLYAWDHVSLALDLCWEIQTYFSHIGLQKYYSSTGKAGQFSTQGLTTGILVSF